MHQKLKAMKNRSFAFLWALAIFFLQSCSAGVHISPELSSILPISSPDAATAAPGVTPTSPATDPILQTSNYLADPTISGHVLDVCAANCSFALPSLAIAAAVDGDTIVIQPGDYVDCAFLNKNNIILRGVLAGNGNRPKIHSKTCGRKGIFVISGANTLIENLELYGAQYTDYGDNNWAGIRLDSNATAKNLIVRKFHLSK